MTALFDEIIPPEVAEDKQLLWQWLTSRPLICRYCKGSVIPSEAIITHAYWGGSKFVCHTQCKQQGEKSEAYDCQCIDSDCNDCRHYQRGRLDPKIKNVFIDGHCLKFDKTTLAQPNKWTGHECFEHRRPNPELAEALYS